MSSCRPRGSRSARTRAWGFAGRVASTIVAPAMHPHISSLADVPGEEGTGDVRPIRLNKGGHEIIPGGGQPKVVPEKELAPYHGDDGLHIERTGCQANLAGPAGWISNRAGGRRHASSPSPRRARRQRDGRTLLRRDAGRSATSLPREMRNNSMGRLGIEPRTY